MMAPLSAARMIGITCFAAKMQLLRLIATQWSIASSVISSSSASPPARLTPTLLCRMSMRPQRAVRFRDHGLDVALLGDVGLEGHRRAALGPDHADGFLRGCEVAVDAQHAWRLRAQR